MRNEIPATALTSMTSLKPSDITSALPRLLASFLASLRSQGPTEPGDSPLSPVLRYPKSVRLGGGTLIRHRGSLPDRAVIDQVFTARCYSLSWMRRRAELISYYQRARRPLIVDCGANIGASPLWFATAFPNARVVAIEPASNNFSLLERNTSNHPNIQPVQAAILGQSGSVHLVDPGMGEWGYRVSPERSEARVGEARAITIDQVIEEADTPFILKIDIEGAEVDMFRTPSASLARFPLVIIELHDWMLPGQRSSTPFLRWHVDNDREFLHLGENLFSLRQAPL